MVTRAKFNEVFACAFPFLEVNSYFYFQFCYEWDSQLKSGRVVCPKNVTAGPVGVKHNLNNNCTIYLSVEETVTKADLFAQSRR